MSYQDIAKKISLTAPAVRERIRKMDDHGVIEKFTIKVNNIALGFPLEAIVRMEPFPNALHALKRLVEDMDQVVDCWMVTGEDCFVARVVLRDVSELDGVINPLRNLAKTHTSVIHATPVSRTLPPL